LSEGERAVPHQMLVERLSHGWRAAHADVARDFVSRWRNHLNCDVDIKESGDGWLPFTCDLSKIRLLGMDSVPRMLIGGDEKDLKEHLEELWRSNSFGTTPFLITTSTQSLQVARSVLPPDRCLLLGPDLAIQLLESAKPVEFLKRELRHQIPRRGLIPFNVERPAEGGMFCGRSKFVDKLRTDLTSFALAGPARLGKTSLLRRLKNDLIRSRDPAALSTFYISLYRFKDRTPDGIAQLIALAIDGRSKNSTINCERLEQLFQFWSHHFHRPLDLLLDEVDEVLPLRVFDTLEMISRSGYCRLIVAGKAQLLNEMLSSKRALAGRLALMRLDPLTSAETEDLFLRPMDDLGFQAPDRQKVLEMIESLTGRMPYLIQYYGRALVQMLLDRGLELIDTPVIEDVRDSFEASSYCLSPVMNLTDTKTRTTALALLKVPKQTLSIQQVQSIVRDHGLILSFEETRRICNDLILENVLAWNRGFVEIANGTMIHHARTSGLIPGLLKARSSSAGSRGAL